ncbi:hypothetical protein ColTof4_09906 [Colletotrichum tofieldiae]|uniref:Uncharacterized protein n=1 Tax=Colletotrichum tofieldiae TaxID=708197 RepID=A0A166RF51_9PEZI|nr:hypothetical protein CT0861_03910 [Colletotrichum tofieldiae]GKT77483.1 hypothetical protein ColTof4_09906 [Colletotrichum tofieldiae]GKT86111.1 hypothetical protein Ct61P_03961 [Colletotrichum tofieldiae]
MATTHSHPAGHPHNHLDNRIDGESADIAGESDLLANELSGLTLTDRSRPRRLPRPDLNQYPSDRPYSTRAPSPTGSVRSAYTTRRRVSRTSWSAGGFSSAHRSEISKELTSQAEGEFFALTELMASMSRRSLSLREVWSKIIAEREAAYAEMDRMCERYEELTEVIEQKEKEHSHHNHDQEERKQELVKVRFELTAAINSASDFKLKLAERDTECKTLRHEIAESKDSLTYIRKEHEELKKTSEQMRLTLVATEAARADLDDRYGKLRGEREALDLRYTDLQSRHEEVSSHFESTNKELVQYKQSNTMLKKEKHELLHKEGELEDSLRKVEHRHDEIKRKYKELEELYEKRKHELKELHETVTRVKTEKEEAVTNIRHEKEELEQHIERLKREIEEEHGRCEDAEDRCGKWKLKWEHSEREIISVREEISRIEITQSELRETISKKSEELRVLIIEKKRIQEEGERATSRADDNHRQLLLIQETLSHTESLLKKTQEEVHTKTERIERLELDYGLAKSQVEKLEMEIHAHQSLVADLRIEVDDLNGQCGTLKEKCHDWERKYEDVYESITEIEEGSSSYEYEISAMRTMLREAREQKETAITARNSADRERDEAVARFEEKCRELERLEERMSAQMHEMSQRSGSKTITTTRSYKGGSHRMASRSGASSPADDC